VDFLEIIVGVLLAIAIAILVIYLAGDLIYIVTESDKLEAFGVYLDTAFNFVIGIEFIKMLCKHTPETVIEVLLFAIARGLIVGHMSTIHNLIGILSIVIGSLTDFNLTTPFPVLQLIYFVNTG
jgi:hypothetical protein